MKEAVIVAATRTPIGKAFKGSLVECRPDDLTALIIKSLLEKTPGLEASDVAQRFVMGLMFFSLAWTIALLYQLRTGYSMSLIVTSLVISTMFMCTMLNFYASGSVQDGGNTFLSVNIIGNFLGSLIVFFRLQSQH